MSDMNETQKQAALDMRTNVEDVVSNIKAVKGERYATAVSIMFNVYQLSVLASFTQETAAKALFAIVGAAVSDLIDDKSDELLADLEPIIIRWNATQHKVNSK